MQPPPTAIRDYLRYEPETGSFFWIKSPALRHLEGREAGAVGTRGYVIICFRGRQYRANILAWYFSYGVWPEQIVDHKNLVTSDNRISNLRLATKAQNRANASQGPMKGIYLDPRTGRYQARIGVNYRNINLGFFATLGEAQAAYLDGARKYFGEFARSDK
jgi:hypothetical protein